MTQQVSGQLQKARVSNTKVRVFCWKRQSSLCTLLYWLKDMKSSIMGMFPSTDGNAKIMPPQYGTEQQSFAMFLFNIHLSPDWDLSIWLCCKPPYIFSALATALDLAQRLFLGLDQGSGRKEHQTTLSPHVVDLPCWAADLYHSFCLTSPSHRETGIKYNGKGSRVEIKSGSSPTNYCHGQNRLNTGTLIKCITYY